MWQMYNPNPCGRAVGDCAIRALTKALDVDWETAFLMVANNALLMCDMPSSNSVIGSVLRENGFKRYNLDNEIITFGEFAEQHPDGISVLCSGSHVATAINGIIFDAWDSSNEYVAYIWHKKI